MPTAEVKWWATEPPPTRAEPVRQYGYALIYVHSVSMRPPRRRGEPPTLEFEYAVVAEQLFDEILPPLQEQVLFERWMMRYPFNMPDYGFDFVFTFD